MRLIQPITDEEKFKRIRKVIESYLSSKHFKDYGELANLLDYSKNTLYQIMAGSRNPPDILIYKFCEYYKLDPAYFFGRSDTLNSIGKPVKPNSEELFEIHESLAKTKEMVEYLINKSNQEAVPQKMKNKTSEL